MFDRLIAPLLPMSGRAPSLPQDRAGWIELGLAVASTWPTALALTSGALALLGLLETLLGGFSFLQAGSFPVVLALGMLAQVALGLLLTLVAALYPGSRRGLIVVFEVLWIVVLPLWGLGINLSLPVCDPCVDQNRALGMPGIIPLYAAYGVAALAYTASRARPHRLGNGVEFALSLALGVGVFTGLLLIVQFGGLAVLAVVFGFLGLPLLAPPVVTALFAGQLAVRAWRGGASPVGAGLAAAVGLAVVDVGAHVAVTGSPELFAGALSQTCGWTFSVLEPPPQDCHYLCTVAARGHPWLVRPVRLGRRRGQVIVVNRQLAVANAFEDLLHERWPRFGRAARAGYDRVGLPLSAWITHPVASDLVFLAMLPAQAGFEAVLWALDRDREARIDRMYR